MRAFDWCVPTPPLYVRSRCARARLTRTAPRSPVPSRLALREEGGRQAGRPARRAVAVHNERVWRCVHRLRRRAHVRCLLANCGLRALHFAGGVLWLTCRNVHSRAHRAAGLCSSRGAAVAGRSTLPCGVAPSPVDSLDLPRARAGLNCLSCNAPWHAGCRPTRAVWGAQRPAAPRSLPVP